MASLTGSLSCVILSPCRELDRDLFPLPGVLSFPATGEAALSRLERSVLPLSLRVFLGDTLKVKRTINSTLLIYFTVMQCIAMLIPQAM